MNNQQIILQLEKIFNSHYYQDFGFKNLSKLDAFILHECNMNESFNKNLLWGPNLDFNDTLKQVNLMLDDYINFKAITFIVHNKNSNEWIGLVKFSILENSDVMISLWIKDTYWKQKISFTIACMSVQLFFKLPNVEYLHAHVRPNNENMIKYVLGTGYKPTGEYFHFHHSEKQLTKTISYSLHKNDWKFDLPLIQY